MGLVENLEFPDHPCDAQMLIREPRKGTSIGRVMAKSKPKSPRKIRCVRYGILYPLGLFERKGGMTPCTGWNEPGNRKPIGTEP